MFEVGGLNIFKMRRFLRASITQPIRTGGTEPFSIFNTISTFSTLILLSNFSWTTFNSSNKHFLSSCDSIFSFLISSTIQQYPSNPLKFKACLCDFSWIFSLPLFNCASGDMANLTQFMTSSVLLLLRNKTTSIKDNDDRKNAMLS